MKRISKKTLDSVLNDFGHYSEIVTMRFNALPPECRRKLSLEDGIMRYDCDFIYENGLVWWGGMEGCDYQPVGSPEDYLKMRDSPKKTEHFLTRLLDRGKLYYGTSYWNQDGETDPANYVVWLHEHCEDTSFRQNLERITVNLLKRELNCDLPFPDYETGMRRAIDYFNAVYGGKSRTIFTLFGEDQVSTALWRAGLKYPHTTEGKAMAIEFENELKKTVMKDERGFYLVRPAKVPDAFKERFKEWYLQKEAKRFAEEEWAPSLNRAAGLLEVVAGIGKPSNALVQLYDLFEQKAKEKWLYHAPNLQSNAMVSPTNIYNLLLRALSALQSNNNLEPFWKELIEKDPNERGALQAVHGFLTPYFNNKGINPKLCDVISSVLQSVELRMTLPPKNELRRSTNTDDFLMVDFLGRHLAHYLTPTWFIPAHNWNSKPLLLDVITAAAKDETGAYRFNITTVNPIEHGVITVFYRPEIKEYQGPPRLQEWIINNIDYITRLGLLDGQPEPVLKGIFDSASIYERK